MSKLLENKTGLILGVANEKSIAWGIAKAFSDHGASLILSYQNSIFEKRVTPLAQTLSNIETIECDVSSDASIETLASHISSHYPKLDFIVHSIAFTERENLKGDYLKISRESFKNTLDISCYSLTAITRALSPFMKDGGSIITLSYYGAEKVISNYNVMGIAKAALECSVKYLSFDVGAQKIRVNTISAGPIKSLAASAIAGFQSIIDDVAVNSPLKQNVTAQDIAQTAVFLASDLSSAITGETIHVDSGYNIIGTTVK